MAQRSIPALSRTCTRKMPAKAALLKRTRAQRIPFRPGVRYSDKGRIHSRRPILSSSFLACKTAADHTFRVGHQPPPNRRLGAWWQALLTSLIGGRTMRADRGDQAASRSPLASLRTTSPSSPSLIGHVKPRCQLVGAFTPMKQWKQAPSKFLTRPKLSEQKQIIEVQTFGGEQLHSHSWSWSCAQKAKGEIA